MIFIYIIAVCEGFGCSQNCDFDVDTMAAVCGCDDGFILSDDGKQCVGMFDFRFIQYKVKLMMAVKF